MRPDLIPRIVNDPFGDPSLFLPHRFQKTAFLFDIGELSLVSRDLLKVTCLFISHTHMDHFCGFDRFLRLLLGREKTVDICGPPGIIRQVEARLSAYSWNLVHRYPNVLRFRVTEIHETELRTCVFSSRLSFKAEGEEASAPSQGPVRSVMKTDELVVTAVLLDHDIPSVAYGVTETARIQIRPDALARHGYGPGPWLGELKQAICAGRSDACLIQPTPASEGGPPDPLRPRPLGELRAQLVRITPGQRIVYATDLAGTPENIRNAVELARDADHLFIEAAFVEADQDHARSKRHLTARQAGWIIGASGARRYTLLHFSARYEDVKDSKKEMQAVFYKEAREGVEQGMTERGRKGDAGRNTEPVPCPFSYSDSERQDCAARS